MRSFLAHTGPRTRALTTAAAATLVAAFAPAAAHAADTLVQAESMTPSGGAYAISDSAATGTKALKLPTTGSTGTQSVYSSGASALEIRVRGQQCSGAPTLVAKLGDRQVMSVSVAETSYTTKRVPLTLAAGTHRISVSFTNNYKTSETCDRNLFVDQVKLTGIATTEPAPAPAPSPTPTPTPTPDTSGSVLWGSGFEDGNLSIYKSVRKEGSGTRGSHVITTERARTGSRSMKITLPASTSGGTVGRYQPVANMPDGVSGQERWYGYSLSLGSEWNLSQIDDNREYFFFGPGFRYTQTTVNGPGSALEADRINGAATFYTGSNLSNTVGATTAGRFTVGNVFSNQWMDFVYHIKWSTGSDGFREVWRDGVKVGRYDGPTLGTKSAFELRTGIYQGTAVNQTRTMYVDNHRVGTSYAAVDPAR